MLTMRDPPTDHNTDAYLQGSTVLAHRRTRCRWPDTGHGCNARMPPRSSCSAWTAPVVPRHEPGVSVMMDLLRPSRTGSCSSSVDLQHSVVRVLFSPSAMLDFSPSRERVSGWKLDLPIIPGVTHKERIPWPFSHHVPLHKMLKTDLISIRLRLGQKGDFIAIHRFDIPCHTGDQWGYVDWPLAVIIFCQ